MCEPVSLISTAVSAAGSIAGHQAESAAVEGRNRAKLRNFEEQNKLYDREVMFDRAKYKNDMALADIDQDATYQAMVDQWSQADQQLDRLFAQGDQKIEKAIVKMYENDYAGTQTGKTAARLAGKSAKKLGQYKSEVLHNMMMSEEETMMRKEQSWNQAQRDSQKIFEKVRFAPIHGATPMAPELEAKPSSASMILGIAGAAASGLQQGMENKAMGIGSGKGGKETSWNPNRVNWSGSGQPFNADAPTFSVPGSFNMDPGIATNRYSGRGAVDFAAGINAGNIFN